MTGAKQGWQREPAPATLFRLSIWDEEWLQLVQAAKKRFAPLLNLRSGSSVRKIEAAQSVEALIDLAPGAVGPAKGAWHRRMRAFGPAAAAALAEILPDIQQLEDENLRARITQLMLSELRWHGSRGADLLAEIWDRLDGYTAGLGCVVFGVLGMKEHAERIWAFYRSAGMSLYPNLIGALWGLLDLEDARLAGELDALLRAGTEFFELYGFLARAGGAASLGPLLERAMPADNPRRMEAWLAAAGISHRSGKDAAAAALWQYAGSVPDEAVQAEEAAGSLLDLPADAWREAFILYYRGFRREDVANILPEMD